MSRVLPVRVLAALGLAACSATSVEPQAPVRVALLADSHVVGPDYVCCSETPGIDNDSIMKGGDRLAAARDRLNALDPPVQAAFILGDVMHDAYPWHDDVFAYADQPSAFSVSSDILEGFDMPVHLVWGNHDYEVRCDGSGVPREVSEELFLQVHDQPLYQAVDVGEFRFMLLNGQLGPTWDPQDERCDPDTASYGAEQLAWIDAQLADGRPTFAMNHYMSVLTEEDEDPGGPHPDLNTVLARHDNLQLSFVGHTHRWLDFRADPDWPHIVLGAVRYDADNFWILELTPGTDLQPPSWRIEDEAKARWFDACADTWSYEGAPALVPDAEETGDCP